ETYPRGRVGPAARPSVMDERVHRPRAEPRPTLQKVELDDEREAIDHSALPLDEPRRRRRRTAGGEQIVDDEAAPLLDRVLVHLERVGAVLERVGLARGLVRQLARLAHRHEADAEA